MRGMRILFATTRGAGHFLPLVPLAHACVRAGHEVLVAGPGSAAPLAARAGLPFRAVGEAPADEVAAALAPVWSPTHAPSAADVIGDVFVGLLARTALPGMLAAVAAWRPDVVVRETMEFASALAAERHGVPHVRFGIHLASETDTDDRLTGLAAARLAELRAEAGLPPDPDATAIRRSPVFTLAPRSLADPDTPEPTNLRRFRDPLAPGAYRRVGHLPAGARRVRQESATGARRVRQESATGGRRVRQESAPGGDFESSRAARSDLSESSGAAQSGIPESSGDALRGYRRVGRVSFAGPTALNGAPPLVYVSFGSEAAASDELFPAVYRAAIDALGALPVRVLVAIGERRDPGELGPLPANVRVVRWVAQAGVMREAAVTVSHGGSGSTLSALAAGVPQAFVPLFVDGPVNAARVAALGAGVVVDDARDLAGAVGGLLAEPGHRRAASLLAAEIRALPPIDEAVGVLAALARHRLPASDRASSVRSRLSWSPVALRFSSR